jgi:hypothetical protein
MQIKRQVKNEARKKWSCNLKKILSYSRYAPLFANFSKGGTHIIAIEVRMVAKKL